MKIGKDRIVDVILLNLHSLLYPLIVVITAEVYKLIVDFVFENRLQSQFNIYFYLYVYSGILALLIMFGGLFLIEMIRLKETLKIRNLVFGKLFFISPNILKRKGTGYFLARTVNEPEIAANLNSKVLHGWLGFIYSSLWYISFVFFQNVALGLLTILSMILLTVVLFISSRRSKNLAIHSMEANAMYKKFITEVTKGIIPLKTYLSEQFALKKAQHVFNNAICRFYYQKAFQNMIFFLYEGIPKILSTILIYGVGGYYVIKGRITLGSLLAMGVVFSKIVRSTSNVINFVTLHHNSKGAFERIKEIMAFPECEGGGKDLVGIDDIEFRDVWFRYNRDWVLCGISFNIKRGEWVSIVGRSGVGKSTLVRMISGFIEPDKGDVIIGGIDLRELSRDSLRRHIGVIPQEVYIFSWSLKENILMGMEVEERKLEEVIEKAGLQGVVEKLPDGLDTLLGEGGYILSGGERQRIGIARVLVRSPDVVIFDEATSSLDSYSEGLIRERLREWSKERMVIVIAHRLSTVKGSERILFIESGKVAGEGRHEELLNIPEYKQLIKEQMI